MKKLIIWDFDGVVADTEKLWIETRKNMINKNFGKNWSFETAFEILSGTADKDKKFILKNLGIEVDDNFWVEAHKEDMKKISNGIETTKNIEEVFKLKQFEHCIATGGNLTRTNIKIEKTGIRSYFDETKVFTSDLVERGKPEPDLFLLAAKKMGFEPKDCIVIEDSVAGLQAAKKAGMFSIAFVAYNKPNVVEKIKELKIEHIFCDMLDIKDFLLNNFD